MVKLEHVYYYTISTNIIQVLEKNDVHLDLHTISSILALFEVNKSDWEMTIVYIRVGQPLHI